MKTCRNYFEDFDCNHRVTTNLDLLEKLGEMKFSLGPANAHMPILNERFIDLLEIGDFRRFKSLFSSYANQCVLPAQLSKDAEFMSKIAKTGIKQNVLPSEIPEIYNVTGTTDVTKGV